MRRLKVGLVSTFPPERCGHAEYASQLMQHTDAVDFIPIGRPLDAKSVIERCKDVDVVHFNHAWQLFGDLNVGHIRLLKEMGKKVVITLHESTTENRSEFTMAFNRVIVHQDTSDGFTKVNDGIYDIKTSKNEVGEFIGIVGFPFEYKNYALAAKVANAFNFKIKAFIPESQHGSAATVASEIMQACPGSEILLISR